MTDDLVEQLKTLQPMQVEGRCLENLDQWPSLQRCVFRECQFPHLDIHARQLSELRFEQCSFGDIRIEGSTLDQIGFDRCEVRSVQVSGSALSNIAWHQCTFGPWTSDRSTLKKLQFFRSSLESMEFSAVDGRHCSLVDSQVGRMHLSHGQWRDLTLATSRASALGITNVRLERLLLGQSQFESVSVADSVANTLTSYGSKFASLQMLRVQVQGLSWYDSAVSEGAARECLMPVAVVSNCHLKNFDMRGCQMPQAIFDGTELMDCDLRGINAWRISMRRAKWFRVDLSGADLSGLNATGAVVSGLRLKGTNCCDGILHGQREEDWDGADLDDTEFKPKSQMDDSMWWSVTRPGPREGAFA